MDLGTKWDSRHTVINTLQGRSSFIISWEVTFRHCDFRPHCAMIDATVIFAWITHLYLSEIPFSLHMRAIKTI